MFYPIGPFNKNNMTDSVRQTNTKRSSKTLTGTKRSSSTQPKDYDPEEEVEIVPVSESPSAFEGWTMHNVLPRYKSSKNHPAPIPGSTLFRERNRELLRLNVAQKLATESKAMDTEKGSLIRRVGTKALQDLYAITQGDFAVFASAVSDLLDEQEAELQKQKEEWEDQFYGSSDIDSAKVALVKERIRLFDVDGLSTLIVAGEIEPNMMLTSTGYTPLSTFIIV
jgi:hypothetical protein